jgi:polysaccharide biosynthesis transport protein
MTALDPDHTPTPDRRRALSLAEPAEAELVPVGPEDAHAPWTGDSGDEGGGGPSMDRYLAALGRFKWLIVLFVAFGGVLGVIGTRYINPTYVVQAIVSISPASRQSGGGMDAQAKRTNTLEMLTSFRVVDPVVRRMRLYVTPRTAGDSAVFRDFALAPSIFPGDYLLQLEGGSYRLLLDETRLVESGAVGDSIGRTVGFEWQPQANTLAGRSELAFTVRTPREVSVRLLESMEPRLLEGSSLLIMSLEHPSPALGALILNAWAESFVAVATEIQRAQVERRADILDGQLEFARNELSSAERALENYRVATATLPSESRIPQLAGMQLMQDPTFAAYTQQQVEVQSLQRDRAAISRALTAGADAGPSTEALLSIPTIATDPAATELRQSLDEAFKRETRLRELRQQVTEEYPEVITERPGA